MLTAAFCRFQDGAIRLPTRYIDMSFLVSINLQINFFRFCLDTTLRNAGATHYTDEETEACFLIKRVFSEARLWDSDENAGFKPAREGRQLLRPNAAPGSTDSSWHWYTHAMADAQVQDRNLTPRRHGRSHCHQKGHEDERQPLQNSTAGWTSALVVLKNNQQIGEGAWSTDPRDPAGGLVLPRGEACT